MLSSWVLNNGTLGFVELEMKAGGFPDVDCALRNRNFAVMAQSIGIKGIHGERPQELRDAVREVLDHNGAELLDGRASELIDLAKVNLVR